MGADHREGTVQGRRILVIANETVSGVVLHEAIRFRARNVGGEVLVVAPVLDTATPEWTTDSDGARRSAEADGSWSWSYSVQTRTCEPRRSA